MFKYVVTMVVIESIAYTSEALLIGVTGLSHVSGSRGDDLGNIIRPALHAFTFLNGEGCQREAEEHQNRLMQLEGKEHDRRLKSPPVNSSELYGSTAQTWYSSQPLTTATMLKTSLRPWLLFQVPTATTARAC